MSLGNDERPESPPLSAEVIYGAIAARRLQFDNLLWQVPVLSLTAQAFLFSIALAGGSTRYARTVACVLSIVTSFVSVQAMTRHRQAEIVDAHWLEDLEATGPLPGAHGREWRRRRNETSAEAGVFDPLRHLPGYRTWAIALATFGLAALLTLVATWAAPGWLR
ncbi:MAG: hypothetical protein QM572_08785 [Nocardioides sp.]|uniref:hypothetical protein n=1 Tax=Nocardioides sp. TaxID=35761 RepID=UPI0039E640BB